MRLWTELLSLMERIKNEVSMLYLQFLQTPLLLVLITVLVTIIYTILMPGMSSTIR